MQRELTSISLFQFVSLIINGIWLSLDFYGVFGLPTLLHW